MRKLFIAFLFCLLIASPLFAQAPRVRHGETAPTSWLPSYIHDWCRDWTNPHAVYYFNGEEDTLRAGDVALFRPMILVDSLARASAADTLTIADSLDFFFWNQIRAKSLNATTACTLFIQGLDTALTAQVETLVLSTSDDGVVYSTNFWRKVNLAIVTNAVANDSFVVYGVPYHTVYIAAAAANVYVAGVVAAKSNPDTYVKVYTSGICQARLIGATTEVLPGMYIESSATERYGQVNATPAAGKRVGRALEGGVADTLYWIWVNP